MRSYRQERTAWQSADGKVDELLFNYLRDAGVFDIADALIEGDLDRGESISAEEAHQRLQDIIDNHSATALEQGA